MTGAPRVLAIDPGPEHSGWCLLDGGRVHQSGVTTNEMLLYYMRNQCEVADRLAIERIESYGMAVGASVFRTCEWAGRFWQAWHTPNEVLLIPRKDVKLHLCGSPRAKDANIRQALIDLLGPQGSKKTPGPTYGVKSHAWAALGVAVTAAHQLQQNQLSTEGA